MQYNFEKDFILGNRSIQSFLHDLFPDRKQSSTQYIRRKSGFHSNNCTATLSDVILVKVSHLSLTANHLITDRLLSRTALRDQKDIINFDRI